MRRRIFQRSLLEKDIELLAPALQSEFISGVFDIVPASALLTMVNDPECFSARLFSDVDIKHNDFLAWCTYGGSLGPDEKSAALRRAAFERTLRRMTQSQLRKLITFITAYPSVPLGSMAELCRHAKITIEFVEDPKRLPEARTCFFYLILPIYSSESECLEKLDFVISQSCEFRFV